MCSSDGSFYGLARRLCAKFQSVFTLVICLGLSIAALHNPVFAQNSATPKIIDARVAGDDTRTRFIIDMDKGIDYGLSFLASPYRMIVDLPEVGFQFAEGFMPEGRGLVSSWRYGLISKGRSRIVLDLDSPVILDKAFLLPGVQDQPTRLVIDLVQTSHSDFVGAIERGRAEQSAEAASVPVVSAAAPASNKPIIVIDPGHGGIDSGAVGKNGTLEKHIVLDFAGYLKEKLEAQGHYTIHLTRDDDRFIPLRGRSSIARELNADLFISIHADSVRVGAKSTRGASVYTLSEKASDRMAAALADRENLSDAIAGIEFSEEEGEVSDILVELTRRETKNFSIHFARLAVEELKSATKVINNPLRSAGFQVLKSPDVPSVLVELGFLSNSLDEKMLGSDEWRERATDALVQSVAQYFRAHIAASEK
ncbi:N-acetylmuramoyl-L-alanine amidase [Rhodobacteraceae bacterium RKSG542]|uniref:N-acetylmuramoyl-L-alanine amidase n=1 Tax=Pseudovibrio flavus TaxID=2529854 RepID=UPI0012BB6322|nr:N-acetylmuramoyl-L-alanine amidase [Pseudovibrio flavus]MTI17277.1 N-acetylmuramoyl-L-alanine amidase [Pseudovibrio flavus]